MWSGFCRNCSNEGWWSLSERADPTSYVVDGGVRSLSGAALSDLLSDVLARGVPFRFEASGYSMLPFLRGGDILTVSPLRRRARLGDVVAAVTGPSRGLVVHRVSGRRGDLYHIRADNGHDPADIVASSAVLGIVTRAERGSRTVRLGLGPEGVAIAALVRLGALQPLTAALRSVRKPFIHRGAVQ
jgi:hypothetical protein